MGRIAGYTMGEASVAPAPISLAELEELKKSALFGEEDVKALRASRAILEPHVEELLDLWYGFVGSTPHLLQYFARKSDGQPDASYLAAVRLRFRQWVLDTAAAQYNQDWLNYQFEIGRRHHRSGKNRTDSVLAADHIPLRHVLALVSPITYTLRPFLARGGASPDMAEKMYQAWLKSVLLQVTLWSYPYVRDGDF